MRPSIPGEGPSDAQGKRTLWQRYLSDPVLAQLKQGTTPEKISLSLAMGIVLAVFPVIGITTVLCITVAWLMRLNQPIVQLINYVAYPLQIALLPGFIRIGEWIFGAEKIPFSIPQLLEKFRASPLHFFQEFAVTYLHCITAWLIMGPPTVALLYYALLPIIRATARRTRRVADPVAEKPLNLNGRNGPDGLDGQRRPD